jgi:D-alanyl-D-alanine dipeptidase
MHSLVLSLLFIGALNAYEFKLIDLKTIAPSIQVKLKYFSQDNFVGEMIEGYQANKCMLLETSARALKKAQIIAQKQNLSLLVYDCYRPQRAVDHFVRWSQESKNTKTKTKYYPHIKKHELFELGYIAKKSGHSRGSTIDLTLVDLKTKKVLDMGTRYDYLDPLSHTMNPNISTSALKNRKKLLNIMMKAGFKNYSKEWWHYTLDNEPNKNIYLNEVIK